MCVCVCVEGYGSSWKERARFFFGCLGRVRKRLRSSFRHGLDLSLADGCRRGGVRYERLRGRRTIVWLQKVSVGFSKRFF